MCLLHIFVGSSSQQLQAHLLRQEKGKLQFVLKFMYIDRKSKVIIESKRVILNFAFFSCSLVLQNASSLISQNDVMLIIMGGDNLFSSKSSEGKAVMLVERAS